MHFTQFVSHMYAMLALPYYTAMFQEQTKKGNSRFKKILNALYMST